MSASLKFTRPFLAPSLTLDPQLDCEWMIGEFAEHRAEDSKHATGKQNGLVLNDDLKGQLAEAATNWKCSRPPFVQLENIYNVKGNEHTGQRGVRLEADAAVQAKTCTT